MSWCDEAWSYAGTVSGPPTRSEGLYYSQSNVHPPNIDYFPSSYILKVKGNDLSNALQFNLGSNCYYCMQK